MKANYLFIFSLLLIWSCESNPDTGSAGDSGKDQEEINIPEELTISRERAGVVYIDMPVEELNALFEKNKLKKAQYTSEGQSYEGFFVYQHPNSPSLRIDPLCAKDCKVWKINIFDPQYRTKAGLGIGSSINDIKKYHIIDWIGTTEDGPAVKVERFGITFVLDPMTMEEKLIGSLVKENLPDSAKVKSVVIMEGQQKESEDESKLKK